MGLPKIVVIVGPTASGKSALAVDVAKRFDGEVVCADSRTVYKGMDVGTAKPEGEWKAAAIERGGIGQLFGSRQSLMVEGIPHWGLDLVNPDEEYSAAQFKTYATERIADILRRGKLPIIVGGTGMWVWVLVDNLTLTETPPNPEVRAKLEARSLSDLFSEYKMRDPEGAEVIDQDNKRRVVRALEVTLVTGKPFSEQMKKGEPMYEALQIGLEIPREELNQRIDDRVDIMIAKELVNEVRALRDQYGCDTNAMSGIGYKQICGFLEGKMKLVDAIEETKKATRAYAKRQMTWFRRDPRIKWITNPNDAFPLITKNAP